MGRTFDDGCAALCAGRSKPLERVRLEETRCDALCSVQGGGGGSGLRDGTRDGRLPTVGLQPLRQDLCHRQR